MIACGRFRPVVISVEALTNHNMMVPPAGVEPATLGLERPCSIQLSYRGTILLLLGRMYSKKQLLSMQDPC